MEEMMMEEDWQEVDRESRLQVSAFLECSGFSDVGESTGKCCWDLSGVSPSGKKVSVEVKDRSFGHLKFGDVCIELFKVQSIQKYGFDTSLAISVFNDGYIAAANYTNPAAKHFKRYAKLTTKVKGGPQRWVLKDFVSLPQTCLFKSCKLPNGKYKFQKER